MDNSVRTDASTSADDLLDRLIYEAQNQADDISLPGQETPTASIDPMAGILSNPAVLQNLPKLVGGLGHILGKDGNNSPSSAHVDRHTALLCAIKPYLSFERQQAADHLITLCRMWSTLEGMGISLPSLLSGLTSTKDEEGSHV